MIVRIALEPIPDETPSEPPKHEEVDVRLPRAVTRWHRRMADLYGIETIEDYIDRAVLIPHCCYALVFEIDDLLSIVAPVGLELEGLDLARYLWSEALHSDLEGFWGEGWYAADVDYDELGEDAWRSEVGEWLEDIGEEEHAEAWQRAVGLAIAGEVTKLGELVRELTRPWNDYWRELFAQKEASDA
jgi:hypothetical protein